MRDSKMAKPLTKYQQKTLKKKIAEEKRLEQRKVLERRKNIKGVLKYAGLLLIIIATIAVIYSTRPDPETSPVLKISPESLDLGDISVSGGTVATEIKIENTGKAELILSDMETSCACTTAALIYEGVEGPRFGMRGHGTNPEGWSATIKPGDTASLKIYYDPTVHFDLRGAVTRYITIYSNDPRTSVKSIYITINQVS